MASLKVQVDGSFDSFAAFVKSFPELRLRYMSAIGKAGRGILKTELLSGQELNLTKFPKDSTGRHTITSKVNRSGTSVDIRSYTANLFEKGRKLRSGSKEAPKGIITVKLAAKMSARMDAITRDISASVLDKEMDKV